jgi:hypothetical protein
MTRIDQYVVRTAGCSRRRRTLLLLAWSWFMPCTSPFHEPVARIESSAGCDRERRRLVVLA